MNNELQIALVSGPAYDALYSSLRTFTERTGVKVKVAFRGDHPTLNHHLAGLRDVPYDLVSTHTKYAPSQLRFLSPVDELINDEQLADFTPLLLELSRVNGRLFGLPRNIDVRLLHYRTDLIYTPPANWDELFELAKDLTLVMRYGFVFPGCESGLFGTFYELAEMAGACLFPPDLVPDIENEAGEWALGFLRRFHAEGITPPEFTGWHYEKVHECFRLGRAAMVCDWPGYYSLYRDRKLSAIFDRFDLTPYPVGPAGRSLSYGGGHTFALTKRGAEKSQALELLLFLTNFEQQLIDASHGCVPVSRSVMRQMQNETDDIDRERLAMLDQVIQNHILIPPKFARYPQVEEVLWQTVQRAIIGKVEIKPALTSMRRQIERIVRADDVVPVGSNGSRQLSLHRDEFLNK